MRRSYYSQSYQIFMGSPLAKVSRLDGIYSNTPTFTGNPTINHHPGQ